MKFLETCFVLQFLTVSLIFCLEDLYTPLAHLTVLDVDGKFHVSWAFNETHITFEVQVKARGYVALGVSSNGQMKESDVAIGWVDESGKAFLGDRFALGEYEPRLDENQDYITYLNEATTLWRMIDSSGLRLTLTFNLRQHDAGMLEVGYVVGNFQVIPPHSSNFETIGHCLPECLTEAMGGENEEINVFAVLLHSHLSGRTMRLRHFRAGIEQKAIMEDKNYDFNLQEMRMTREEIVLKKGDSTLVECHYNTEDRGKLTYGGLSTRNEMCLAFVLYYPKIPLSVCNTARHISYLATFAGATADIRTGLVLFPDEYKGQSWTTVMENNVNWNSQDVRDKFQTFVNEDGQYSSFAVCSDGHITHSKHHQLAATPEIIKPLTSGENTCASRSGFSLLPFAQSAAVLLSVLAISLANDLSI